MAEGAAGASEGGEQKANFNDIFSLKRPKDAKSGLASGLKSVGRGIVGGMVGLIAAPVVGASQEGLSGFAKGIATGEGSWPSGLGFERVWVLCVRRATLAPPSHRTPPPSQRTRLNKQTT